MRLARWQGWILLPLIVAACGSREPPIGSGAAWSVPPTSAEIIGVLLRHAELEIRADQPGCDSVFGAPVPRFTVGRYVAFLLGSMAEEPDAGGGSRIEAECAPDQESWACTLWVAVGLGGESPWRYGLRFRVSGDPSEIDPASFSCPGGA